MSFRTYNFGSHFDYDELLRTIPQSAKTRGMFFATVQRALKANGKEPIDGSWIPFKLYPRRENVQVMLDASSKISRNPNIGLFQIGANAFPEFASSVAGRAMFSIINDSFQHIVSLAPRAYSLSVNSGRLIIRELTDSHFHLVWENVFEPVPLTVGIIAGVMMRTNVQTEYIEYDYKRPGLIELKFDYAPSKKSREVPIINLGELVTPS